MSPTAFEESLTPVLAQYDVGAVLDVAPTGSGLLHHTFRLTTANGVFVLQQLHSAIPDKSIDDLVAVTTYLYGCGMRVPQLVATRAGQWMARDAEGGRWRIYPWLTGDVCDALPNVARAESAGRLMGELHRYLAVCPVQLQGGIPHFHDTPFILDELRGVQNQLPPALQSVAADVLARLPSIMVTTQAGPAQMIHGDLKISNMLFNVDEAIGLIDFDTLAVHSPAIDVGDALRSWCNRTVEDDPQAVSDPAFFAAAVAGYEAGVGADRALSAALCRRAAAHVALELTARFLIDVVRDTYFGWDAARFPDRRSHNVARALGQYHLAQSFLQDE